MPPKPSKIEIPEAAQADEPVATVTSAGARRRAGHAFGPAPTHLTRAQLDAGIEGGRTVAEAIEEDPLLVIRPYRPEPEPTGE